ncbi:MAG: helix-turn-helix transcriptional regulator [Bacteroidota bacterium]|nr:helix-turn-helix transcriptional regulator [Bacteroidota bacterium]
MKPVVKPTKPHKHSGYHEIILLSQGAGFHVIDGQKMDVVSPVCFCLSPGLVHCWDFTKIPKGYVIMFREELFYSTDIIQKLLLLPQVIKIKPQDFIFDFAAELLKDYSDNKLTTEILDSSLRFLSAKLLQASQVKFLNHSSKNKILLNYRKQIENSFKITRDVKVYADQLHITPAKLNETCKEILGKTAYDLLKERIFLEAKILLTHTNESVKEIAYELNFTDTSYFVKYFKSQSNLTPKKYRELIH